MLSGPASVSFGSYKADEAGGVDARPESADQAELGTKPGLWRLAHRGPPIFPPHFTPGRPGVFTFAAKRHILGSLRMTLFLTERK